ncbi:MAG: glycerol-3-phosphate acyltransferase [Acidimicrobiales bacterium]
MAAGYLAGSLPSADVAARLAQGRGADLRDQGSGNPGAVNAMAVLGPGWGWAVMAADVAKGAAACAIGARLGGPGGAHLAGTAAVVGHCFPAWNPKRGGKGVAVSLGQCLATFPAYLPADLAVAWAVGRWRGRALPGTLAGSATWVIAATLWWRKGWSNPWGPGFVPAGRRCPTWLLPAGAAISSAVIISRFRAAERRGQPSAAGPASASGEAISAPGDATSAPGDATSAVAGVQP